MDLPVKFPSETDVILEDVASFRALSHADQMQCFRGMVNAGELMLRNSPKAAWLEEYSQEQERLARHRNITGVHRPPWILTVDFCRKNGCEPLRASPRPSPPDRSGMR